jgi:hypothetical protein
VSVLRVTSTTCAGKESVALSHSVVRHEGDPATQVQAKAAWHTAAATATAPAAAAAVRAAAPTKGARAGADSFVGQFVYDFFSSRPSAAAAAAAAADTDGDADANAAGAQLPCAGAGEGAHHGELLAAPTAQYYSSSVAVNEGPAAALMDRCLHYAAANSSYGNRGSITGAQLRKLPQGPSRRSMVDDITVLVVTLTQ